MSTYDVVTTTRKAAPQEQNTAAPQTQQNNQTTTTVEYKHVTYSRQPDLCDFIFPISFTLVTIIGIIGFIKSVRSRRYYKCPVCGESFRSENMTPTNCKICGAELNETDDTNVTDKTK